MNNGNEMSEKVTQITPKQTRRIVALLSFLTFEEALTRVLGIACLGIVSEKITKKTTPRQTRIAVIQRLNSENVGIDLQSLRMGNQLYRSKQVEISQRYREFAE